MVDVILDTNVYGKIVSDKKDGLNLTDEIIKDEKFIIHNFRIIRDELRRASNILGIYDRMVAKNMIQDSKQIDKLANLYHKEYKNNGGGKGKKKILNDFKIVACASIKNFDLVFSEDNKTMKCPNAMKAYKHVNLKNNMRTPTFYSYKDLKKRYLTIY